MFRTSYGDMSGRKQAAKKSYHIPKYQGYIPAQKADNILGQSFTKVSRHSFTVNRLDKPKDRLQWF